MTCKGVHQLAFRFVGRRFQSKLKPDLRESDVQAFLKDRLGKDVSVHKHASTAFRLVRFFIYLVHNVCVYSFLCCALRTSFPLIHVLLPT